MTSFGSGDSETLFSRPNSYCRKEKSLGVLCSNFLRLYDRQGVETVGLDDAAARLGVERRRIYDVVNILESIGIVAKKGKNKYTWKGFDGLPMALNELKDAGLRENFSISDCLDAAKVSNDKGAHQSTNLKAENDDPLIPSKTENRREKSLALLTENFVKLFLCSDVDSISLDNAAMALLGDVNNSKAMRTKIRRLYDIANVLTSMNLIEKTHQPVSRKPAFKWLGWKGKTANRPGNLLDLNEPKKRSFGTDVTNCTSKRNKTESSVGFKPSHIIVKREDSIDSCEKNDIEKKPNLNSKSFVFGPFAPVGVNKISLEKRTERRVQDWDTLTSSYRPNYRNQALCDLFAHYVDAWKSWCFEVGGKI